MILFIIDILKKILIFLFVLVIIIIIFAFKGEVQSIVPKKIKKKYRVQIKRANKRKVFILSPKDDSKHINKILLYLHGGSYVEALNNEHWSFLSDIIDETGIDVILPDYPLTPKYNYKDVFNMVEPIYNAILKEKEDKEFIIMGDSSGGGLALALVQKMSIEKRNLPEKTILLSPWLDVTMKNPDIAKVEPNDPDLNKLALIISGKHYSGKDEKDTYLVSPINGPLENLKNVTIFTGTYDILNPDAKLLVEKAKKVGVEINLREYEKAVHIWMLKKNNKKSTYMAEEAYKEIVALLKDN